MVYEKRLLMKKISFKKIITYLSLILFIILTILVLSNKTTPLDNYFENFVLNIRNDALTDIMIIITNISSAYSLIALTILILIILKKKRISLYIAINLITSFLFSQIIKLIIQRPRPIDISLVDHVGYSYPSGHSLVSMAYFGFITYLIFKNVDNKFFRYFFTVISIILIIAIGFSRIYLGVHYFSDVFGGFLLAIFFLLNFINITNKGDDLCK